MNILVVEWVDERVGRGVGGWKF